MYHGGRGVGKSYEAALVWFRKSADQEYARAQFNMGATYDEDNAVPQSYKQAAVWFRKAANQGQAQAQLRLRTFHYHGGRGVPQSYEHRRATAALSPL